MTSAISSLKLDEHLLNLAKEKWWLLAIIVGIYILKALFRNPVFKGWLGEKQAQVFALNKLDSELYTTINDLYLPRPDGKGTTQIDHVVISRFGIFVIETKNYDHWIFGGENQRHWTQKVYNKSYRFQNPLHQNALHINALKGFLNTRKNIFHNIVYFIGKSQFKTQMPSNVLNRGLRGYIVNMQQEVLSDAQVSSIIEALQSHDQTMNKKRVAKKHIKQMRSEQGLVA